MMTDMGNCCAHPQSWKRASVIFVSMLMEAFLLAQPFGHAFYSNLLTAVKAGQRPCEEIFCARPAYRYTYAYRDGSGRTSYFYCEKHSNSAQDAIKDDFATSLGHAIAILQPAWLPRLTVWMLAIQGIWAYQFTTGRRLFKSSFGPFEEENLRFWELGFTTAVLTIFNITPWLL